MTTERGTGLEQIAELERRITVALDRIARGMDALTDVQDVPSGASQGQIAALTDALEQEQQVAAQLTERLRAVKARETEARAVLEGEVAHLTARLDEQGIEMQRMRQVVVQLRDQVRILRESVEQGVTDPHQINRAMLAELEALRATRLAEVAEMDGLLAELAPIVQGAEAAAKGGADA